MKIIAESRFAQFGLTCAGIILALVIIHFFTSSVAHAQSDAGEKVVSYKVVAMNPKVSDPLEAEDPLVLQGRLTALGMAGWHLVGIDHSFYIFSK
ncbi:MAG: hypothetical protein ABSC01_04975 [Verrucomicrobiota bacterium]|jgi:hypothetical protein